MSDRIDINDIQAFFRFTNVEYYLKNNNEKVAYENYQDIYYRLLNAEHKKRAYEGLCSNIRLAHHSQKTIDNVKEIVVLDKEIQKLESQLEDMEQSKLFQNIHKRALYGQSSKFNLKEKIENISMKILQNKELLKVIGYFLLLLWIGVMGDIVMSSNSGILTKIFFMAGIIILLLYIVSNYFLKNR